MKITTTAKHKSIPAQLSFDLPDFSIITGRNGSGKSHLLEILANPASSKVEVDGKSLTNILHVPYNGLNPQVDDRCESAQLINNASVWWENLQGVITNFRNQNYHTRDFEDVVSQYVIPHHGYGPARDSIIRNVLARSGKRLHEITESDIYNNMSFAENDNNSLFFSQCAMIFKAYQTRWTKNKFNKFLNSEDSTRDLPVLSDDEFIRTYGPAPWDLINDILAKANLPYEFINPTRGDVELAYTLKLKDRSNDTDISVNDLSSGEKVLMSIALATYNTMEGGNRPELLLIDEPDAPLHPQFSKLLIETITDTIVKRAGVKVVMTTHSPTTVAMAPDNSVFELSRDTKTPTLISNSSAVSILTQGIGFLRVSYEKRRQIFVESKYDVIYFEKLFDALRRKYNYSFNPIFMEPHTGTSNCTDVIALVDKLRSSGNDLAWGIIDYDGTNKSRDQLLILGNSKRYAIENYILDPLYVTLALIRYGKASYSEFGLHNKATYLDAVSLTETECQTLIDNFITKIELPNQDTTTVTLENGFNLQYPYSFLMHNGHGYEVLIQNKFPALRAISRGQGDSGLKIGVTEVIAELPQYLPVEIGSLFSTIEQAH
ncbi:ATP-binding protein [Pseudomonas sp. SWRI51]|uniref:AAA family ATPase n=1 Tax=Pseudomonas sp. SWRI51 TaxID=2745491 RepID=UPI001646F539|nr:ATP-binding protein [Pseudomonas sp. SWRI51]MBC3410523.1 ATP-binding protein [Pseudomonas sp. SWRI51]